MCTGRIRARVSSAVPIAIGYVSRRKMAFHKRGADGSGKADAAYTGSDGDKVWGVVFSLSLQHKSVLDDHESGYGVEQVPVIARGETITASIYVAGAHSIDASLEPYCWYHRFVLHGALQHRLPSTYVEHLKTIKTVTDHDLARREMNSQILSE